jgi:branched-chain amino acid transport system ATP-binding protein
LTKSFGGLLAVDDVSLEVERKSFTGLIGPNGSGKTTLFNLIAGSLKPDRGNVVLEGKDITGLAPHQVFSRGVYRTFQSPQIVPSLSVLENMLLADPKRVGEGVFTSVFSRRKWKIEDDRLVEKAYEHLKFLSIEQYANSPPTILSGGQLKLLEIGRALMSEAPLLLLDEPAAGVNPTLASSIFDFLEQLRKDHGVTIFLIEHKVDLVFERVDYAFVMNKGKLFFSGSPDEVAREESVIEAYLGE